jgi:geranylgeranyl pyrophosphate synthase
LPPTDWRCGFGSQLQMEGYLTKNFYKTASLIANSCRSSVMLSGRPDEIADAAYRYGKHIGIAFQLVDDALDFSGTTESLGKPALNDLRQGLATAPVLFAAQTHADVSTMIERKFNVPGDAEAAAEYVQQSGGVDKTMALAVAHSQMAVEALELLPDSKWKDALAALAVKVVSRSS